MDNFLILGAKGLLGSQLMKTLNNPLGWDRQEADVLDFENLQNKILNLPQLPSAIINCAAYNDVDMAEIEIEKAYQVNTEFVGKLATLCAKHKIPLVHFSSNYVFDGEKGEYLENDKPNPICVYGASKYEGEKLLRKYTDKFYLIRTAVLFGGKAQDPHSKTTYLDIMLDLSKHSNTIKAVKDEINSLTSVVDLAEAVRNLFLDKKPFGIYHIVNSGEASWYDVAKEMFSRLNIFIDLVPVLSNEYPRKAQRPKKAVLLNTKLPPLRSWQEALKDYLCQNHARYY